MVIVCVYVGMGMDGGPDKSWKQKTHKHKHEHTTSRLSCRRLLLLLSYLGRDGGERAVERADLVGGHHRAVAVVDEEHLIVEINTHINTSCIIESL